uniref:Interleukin-1 n=1 Tax=Capra hircus TaxID=9925 RepID=A0A8C2NL01_CAPHI
MDDAPSSWTMSGLPWLCHVRKQAVLGEPLHPVSGPHTSTDVCSSKTGPPGPTLYPSLLLSHFLTLKMSVLEENPGMKMDCEDWERDEPQCSSEDPDRDALEPGPSLTSVSSAHAGPRVKPKGPEKFIIHDGDQKVLVLDSKILRAVPDRTYIVPEIFFVLASCVKPAHENQGSPILLAVSKGELCLCCDKNKGHNKPSLQLKKKKLSTLAAQEKGKCLPFIFYRNKVGSRNTLESAAHPGWFICTFPYPGKPVGMTKCHGKRKHTEFSFRQIYEAETSPSEVSE